MFIVFLSFLFWHKFKIQLQERTQNTTNMGEPYMFIGNCK